VNLLITTQIQFAAHTKASEDLKFVWYFYGSFSHQLLIMWERATSTFCKLTLGELSLKKLHRRTSTLMTHKEKCPLLNVCV